MKSQFKCLLCGALYERPHEASGCCQSYIEVWPCDNCGKEHYSEIEFERCDGKAG